MTVHQRFKLNGKSYSKEALLVIAHKHVNEPEAYKATIGKFLLEWLSSSETITVSTSGSTGIPKLITLKKEQMINSALASGSFFKLKAGDSAFLCLPCDFIAGKMMLVRAMVLGLELDYVAPSSKPVMHDNRTYDFAAMIPLQAQNLISKLNNIKQLIIGGAVIHPNLEAQLKASTCQIYATYGMTETITHIAVRKLADSYFKTLSGVTVTTDKRECLVIDAPQISDTKLITNDLVKLISNSEFEWLGRYDSIINSGGLKLIPEQIETKLNSLITARFFVAGLSDQVLGEKLVAFIEGEEDFTLLQKMKSIKALSKYEVPKEIYFLPKFIETENGKLNRLKTLELLKR